MISIILIYPLLLLSFSRSHRVQQLQSNQHSINVGLKLFIELGISFFFVEFSLNSLQLGVVHLTLCIVIRIPIIASVPSSGAFNLN